MPEFTPPLRDTRFVLDSIVAHDRLVALPGLAVAAPEVIDAILEQSGRFAAEVLFPLNQSGDMQGCARNADGSVTTPDGFKAAYEQFVAAGWSTLSAPVAFGGQGLPHVVTTACQEYMISANMAFAMCPSLTRGAVATLLAIGSPEQQAKYIPPMVEGRWSGTMNLTEPHCGTDLGLIRTRAVVQADGSYRLNGTKTFISSGEHDLTENIIHLVLARTPDAQDGAKGLSLFVVPKVLVEEDGTLGARNAVSCTAIERKMGIHANPTCTMHYDDATGWRAGEDGRGLAAMFVMMNAARLGVGLQGLAIGEVAYQNAVRYAHDRRQGRSPAGPTGPDRGAEPIIGHPDVRRMLMDAKALTEGLRALCLWIALQVDLQRNATDARARRRAEDLVGLLTPVFKAFGTDKGYEVATNAQQVYGGHGYIVASGMEQYVRDARVAMLYEGTNGVQAMDLVARKRPQNGGRAIETFAGLIGEAIAAAEGDATLTGMARALGSARDDLIAATQCLTQQEQGDPTALGASAQPYLHLFGFVSLGLMWLRMARAARQADGQGDPAFNAAKITTARYYFDRLLPETTALRRKIESGSDAMMALPAAAFFRL